MHSRAAFPFALQHARCYWAIYWSELASGGKLHARAFGLVTFRTASALRWEGGMSHFDVFIANGTDAALPSEKAWGSLVLAGAFKERKKRASWLR